MNTREEGETESTVIPPLDISVIPYRLNFESLIRIILVLRNTAGDVVYWMGIRMRILVIEDNALFRESLSALLHSRYDGIEVIESADGHEALALAYAHRPDLVFIDIQLPDITGLEITRNIKHYFPITPIAILTSYDLPEYRAAAIDCGADHFLGKDTSSADDILDLMARYLRV